MKDSLVFDTTGDFADQDKVGAYVVSEGGELITSTTDGAKERLDVSSNIVDAAGNAVTTTAEGPKRALDVNLVNPEISVIADDLDVRPITQADEITVFQGTASWTVSATDLDIRNLDHAQDNVAIAKDGNVLEVEADGSINVNANLTRDIDAIRDSILIAGTEDGTKTGTLYYFVNNLRKQILDSADRQREVVWADFTNRRLRRVVQFDYTSPTFPGITARKVFNYTLVGNEYRFDGDSWSIVI